MYTDDVEDEEDEDEDAAGPAPDPDGVLSDADTEGRPFLPLTGVPPTSSFPFPVFPTTTLGSSNCPAGVINSPPSGLKANLKKFV